MSIETLIGLTPPARSYEWEVNIMSPYIIDDKIKFHAQSAQLPPDSSDVMEINYRWYKLTAPGRDASSKEITLEFWESEDLSIYRQLSAWRTAVQDWDTGLQGRLDEIVGVVTMDLLSQTGSSIGTWTLIYAWPKEIGQIDLNYDSSDPVKISVTIAFAWCDRPK